MNGKWLQSSMARRIFLTRLGVGVGAASAVMIFMTVAAIIVPYLYSDIRRAKHEG